MEFLETCLPGLIEIQPRVFQDGRGLFVKTFIDAEFTNHGLETGFVEEFYTTSMRSVLRGLHFQEPPYEQVKVIYCTFGSVFDVVVDLRKGSPTFGKFATFDLESSQPRLLYIPPGMAHGFYTRSELGVMQYKVTRHYAPIHDAGVRWDSLGIPWPALPVHLSDRDAQLPLFKDYDSPFIFQP